MKNGALTVFACLLMIGVRPPEAVAAQPSISALGSCAGIADLESYTIRAARLSDPFRILRWRKPRAATLAAVEALKGKNYAFTTVDAVSKQIESESWLPSTAEGWVRIDYSSIGIENCQGQQLDVVFTIFSAAISPTLSSLFEWSTKEKTPNERAGLAQTHAAWQFAPEAGFDSARRLAAGGGVRATWTNRRVPFGAFELKGVGSTESHALAASLNGEHDSATGWLRRATWRVAFRDSSTPTGNDHLDERNLEVQFSGTSKPLNGVLTRFGAVLDGGRFASGFGANDLPVQTVSGSDFTSLKLYGGVTARGHRQAFAGSYALVVGSTGTRFHGDWRRHLGDVVHELWRPISDHRLFEFEQRLTLGRLQPIGSVPVSARFFGGANDEALLLGDDWRLRTNPVIRSIATNRFLSTDAGVGADRFFAYNSTIAFTVWGKPVVPRELLSDKEFRRALQGQLVSARSTLDVVYRSEDPHFKAVRARVPDVVATLTRAASAAAAARSAGVLASAEFEPCDEALQSSRSAAEHVLTDKPFQAYGWVQEMLPDGENALAAVVVACGVDLVAKLKGTGTATDNLESATQNLEQTAAAIEASFTAIDMTRSGARAEEDIRFAERALNVILEEMNVTSISPVFVFDVAHIGPAASDPYGGNRYAIGGGVRLTLMSTVNMTATYAVNPRRRSGEGSGALVFSITTRNLFE